MTTARKTTTRKTTTRKTIASTPKPRARKALDTSPAVEPETVALQKTVAPENTNTAAEPSINSGQKSAPTYTGPYLPRGQWFRMMRETGQLKPRSTGNATDSSNTTPTTKKPRTEAQKRFLAGYYARKRAAATA